MQACRPSRMLPRVVAIGAAVAIVGCRVLSRPVPTAGDQAIVERVAQYGPTARARLAPFFAAAGVAYPPDRFVLLGFKRERELHLLAAGSGHDPTFIRSYPIEGMSGTLGPKLRQGDGQVPEGIYRIVYLNPNSVAHVSLALDYPNDYDRARAAEDGRDTLGGDIMIHGGSMSIGCLAIGDEAAEDLFVLAADAGWEDAVVVVSPIDFRRHVLPVGYRVPAPWVDDLYVRLRAALSELPAGAAETSRRDTLQPLVPLLGALGASSPREYIRRQWGASSSRSWFGTPSIPSGRSVSTPWSTPGPDG